ncbi:hypothetical protein FEM48_Zijuj06G0118400 [Ziziphus jujuba var. spinosa]|uniref:Pollen-specific protein C13-like n=1 Tax=Ziziphus jujuba var. spinosa TaxID=714518 RepID=A0A978V946_ZIZJJ|nr:hypothetical protein FEM48_Zijuj06G0118400 [Ziziphus jujuba var. spinosa]
MAKPVLLLALCILPALALATRPLRKPLIVQGRVYCDTCLAGFETSASNYIAGAKVRLECKNRNTMQLLYSKEGTTDSTGTYKITVTEDHEDQLCDALLVSSPQGDCAKVSPGRERARVILTNYNGMASETRFANAMGFTKEEPAAGCANVLKQYQEFDNED